MEQTRYLDLDRFRGVVEQLQVSANVQRLAELIAEYCDEHPDHHLSAYLAHLATTEAEHADEDIAPLDEHLNAVRLMTVHQAKGLEFELVIVPHLVEGRFPAQRRGEGLTLPDALLSEDLPPTELHLADERRLAYVAVTRAREELVCTWAQRYEGSRDWRPSRFLQAIGGQEARVLHAKDVLGPAPPLELSIVPGQLELPLRAAARRPPVWYAAFDSYVRCRPAVAYPLGFRRTTAPRPHLESGRL